MFFCFTSISPPPLAFPSIQLLPLFTSSHPLRVMGGLDTIPADFEWVLCFLSFLFLSFSFSPFHRALNCPLKGWVVVVVVVVGLLGNKTKKNNHSSQTPRGEALLYYRIWSSICVSRSLTAVFPDAGQSCRKEAMWRSEGGSLTCSNDFLPFSFPWCSASLGLGSSWRLFFTPLV